MLAAFDAIGRQLARYPLAERRGDVMAARVLLRDRLARTGELPEVDALYASHLARAIETAEVIAPALGDPPIKIERELREFR